MSDDNDIKDKYDFLYPLIGDPNFNIKISEERQFWDTRYPIEPEYNIKKQSTFLCNEKEFELLPHQMFVRNYLSSQTPYNSLLLYHGLGTGKTCSAISVCEMHRKYQKQTNNKKKIWIVASPNVKENFKLQLFDTRKLKKINGVWNLRACTGNTYLSEINPMNMKDLSKDLIIREVNKIIKSSYNFIGYTEFSNLIERILKLTKGDAKQAKLLKQRFSDSLIVIDEVHNIRHSADNPQKKVAIHLLKVVKNTINLKLLFLSATPMYNNRDEIIWLLNIMNINDKRSPVEKSQIFNGDGSFNRETLIIKSIGYISYLRGENPYTFPYRIWPKTFNKTFSLSAIQEKVKKRVKGRGRFYPIRQINNIEIMDPIEHLDLFMIKLEPYQAEGYKAVTARIKSKLPAVQSVKAGLGYEAIGEAIQALNIVYPYTLPIKDVSQLFGKSGLTKTMKFNKKRQKFNYKRNIKQTFGHIFSQNEIHKYSAKIASFTATIKHSEGIILIYSRYLDSGCIPIALALEEMGITRYGRESLFETAPHVPVSYDTLEVPNKKNAFIPAKYAMITGDSNLSPNKNKLEMKAITDEKNINGEIVKIVIITKAGAEGLDFKNIRQVHILEPWYNLNRSEQVIGRAVRNCSHKELSYERRNVEIYLYGTMLDKFNKEECADLYIYRKAEIKAQEIGEISRVLKKTAVDCILNTHYNNLSIDKEEKIKLSSKKRTIKFNIRNKPYSSLCDYMQECQYECEPFKKIAEANINDDTYNEAFIIMNLDKIIHRIKMLMKEQFIYKKSNLVYHLRAIKHYPLMQINSALSQLVNDKNQYIMDMFGRVGHLVNIGPYYMFQPIEIDDEQIDRYERSRPLSYKRDKLIIKIPQEAIPQQQTINIIDQTQYIYTCAIEDNKCEDLWASNMYSILQILSAAPFNISIEILKHFICTHLFDSLYFKDKLTMLNYLWNENNLTPFYRLMKEMIKKIFIIKGKIHNIVPFVKNNLITQKNKKDIYILKKKTWQVPTINDLVKGQYQNKIKERYEKENLSDIYGFMGTDKTNHIKFKIKNRILVSKKSHKGFQCITQQKKKTITLLNTLMNKSPIPTWKNIIFISTPAANENEISIKRGFSRSKLCNMEEMILRFYEQNDHNKTWFLSSFGAQYNKIEK